MYHGGGGKVGYLTIRDRAKKQGFKSKQSVIMNDKDLYQNHRATIGNCLSKIDYFHALRYKVLLNRKCIFRINEKPYELCFPLVL